MRSFLALLGLSLKSMLHAFQVGNGKKRAFTGLGTLALLGGVAVYISGTYSFLFAQQLRQVDMLPLLIMLMGVLAVLAGFSFTVFTAQGVLFGGRDNDFLFSMPVSDVVVLVARLMALYLENLLFGLFVMLPAGVIYLACGGGGGGLVLLRLLVGTVLLSLFPTFLTLLAGFVLGWVTARFQRRSALSLLCYGGLLALVLAFSVRASFLMFDLADQAAGVETAFRAWGVPFVLLSEAACDGNLVSLAVLTSLSTGPLLLAVWLFAGRYRAVATRLQSRAAGRTWRPGRERALGPRWALLKKESSRFFSSPVYVFNAGIGVILLLVGAVAALVNRGALDGLLGELSGLNEVSMLPLLAAGVCFLLSTVTITAASVSLEGRQLWILKTAPISVQDLLLTKTGFQLLFTLPVLLVSVPVLSVAFGLGWGEGALLLALGAAMALFSAPFGLLVNLYLPKLDAENEIIAVKHSAAILLGLLVPMALTGLGAGLWFLLKGALGGLGGLLLCLLLLAACAAAAWLALLAKGPILYGRLGYEN